MMGKFRRLLSESELKELYLNVREYTWSNERERNALERLDWHCTIGQMCLKELVILDASTTNPS
jgi:hypothetical protein